MLSAILNVDPVASWVLAEKKLGRVGLFQNGFQAYRVLKSSLGIDSKSKQSTVVEPSTSSRKTKSEQRADQIFSDEIRKSLQTCLVHDNEEKLEGFLKFYEKRNAHHKSQVITALLYVLRQLLASSSFNDERRRGFLHFSEAFGLYSSFFDKPVAKEEFRDQLLSSEYGLRVYIATIRGTR